MKKRIFLVILMVLNCVSLAGCGESTDSSSKLVIGVDDSFPPMGFRDDSGELTGFDIELAKEAAKKMNETIEFKVIDWDSKELELNSGRIDVIWNGLTITDERKKNMLFTNAYMSNSQVIMVKNGSDIKTREDLKNKIVGVQKGSSAEDAIDAFNTENIIKSVSEYPTNVDAFMDLDIGRCDVVIVDEVVARYYSEQNKNKFTILDDTLAAEQYGIAVKNENTKLRDKIQKALDDMNEDGSSKKISEKWFGKDVLEK